MAAPVLGACSLGLAELGVALRQVARHLHQVEELGTLTLLILAQPASGQIPA